MPNDLSISALGPVVAAGSRASPPVPTPHPNPVAERVLPNPSLRLEAALGLVVIEFRNDSGAIETSYPSARQLAAYRANALAGRPATARPGLELPGTGPPVPPERVGQAPAPQVAVDRPAAQSAAPIAPGVAPAPPGAGPHRAR